MTLINEQFRYVAIEGPIGVGKTSLARRLSATFGCEMLLEAPEENPFLERYYADPRGNALATQLHFLFQRSRQSQSLRQSDLFEPVRVADFMFEKDRLFAQLTLDDEELKLYELVFERLAMDAPQPDLVIYLQASVETLLERIARRGINYEQSIDADYLARLAELYTRYFHAYDSGPLLIVNTESADLVTSEADYETLLEQLSSAPGGRRYFNAFRSELG